MSVSMVMRFRASFLRASVRDGADAVEKIRKTDYVTHSKAQEPTENNNFYLIVMKFSLVKM